MNRTLPVADASTRSTAVGRNPFLALQSYTREDRDRLFGRDADLTLVIDRLLRARTTLLFAASGVGKTSFLNARLAPELEDRFFVASHSRWWEESPARVLGESVIECWRSSHWAAGAPAPPAPSPLVDLYRGLRPVEACAGAVLILDQFEEVFQQHADTRALLELVESVCAVTSAPDLDVRLVISMREEFLGELSVFDNRIPDLFNNYYRLKNPSRRQARTIITETVRLCDVQPDGTLDLLITDLAAAGPRDVAGVTPRERLRDSIAPPYLQIACHGLWEAQLGGDDASSLPPGSTFPAGYTPGLAEQHLHAHCKRVLGPLSTPQLNLLADALGFLITRRGAKVAYEVTALAKHSGESEKKLRHMLDALSAPHAKLFRRTNTADGSTWYELYHDMYSAYLLEWRSDHRRARRKRLAATWVAGALAVLLLAGSGFLAERQRDDQTLARLARQQQTLETLEQQQQTLETSLLSAPIQEYALRWGGHRDRVMDVAFSGDGLYIATASFDRSVKVWDARRMVLLHTIQAEGGVHAVAFHPTDSKLIAMAGVGNQLDLYNWRVMRRWTVQVPDVVYTLAFSRNGRMLVCGGNNGLLAIVNTENLEMNEPRLLRVEWPNAVNAAVFTDGLDVLIGDFAGRVAQLSTDDARAPVDADAHLVTRHRTSVLAVASSIEWIASGGRDQRIVLSHTSRNDSFFLDGHTAAVRGLAFSRVPGLLASAGVDGTVRLWNLEARTQVATLLGHVGTVYGVVFDPSGSTLVTSGQDATTRVWDVATRREISQLVGQWNEPDYVQFSADLSTLVTEHSTRGTQVWSERVLRHDYPSSVSAVGLTGDGKLLAVGDQSGSVLLIREGPPPAETRLQLLNGPVKGLIFSGNGEVMGLQHADNATIETIAVANPAIRTRVRFPSTNPAWFAALNETGTLLAVAGTREVAVFNRTATSGAPVTFTAGGDILRMTFDVFGRLVVLRNDRTIEIAEGLGQASTLSVKTNRPVVAGRSRVASVASDTRSSAFVDESGRRIYVRHPSSSDPLELTTPDPVIGMAFARDGNRLMTLDRNGVVRAFAPAASRISGNTP